MVKTWSEDDPKAGLMARKRRQIVDAALEAFLDHGYAESSVNKIAEAAGVSIKTLYRHFETKAELFSAVMQAACASPSGRERDTGPDEDFATLRSWYSEPPEIAFVHAGEEYLRHVLSDEQLAIYRVVVRDAHRFPELHRSYREEIVRRRAQLFIQYIDQWQPRTGWTITDKYGACALFEGLLKATLFNDAVQGARKPSGEEISSSAHRAAKCLLALLEAGLL
jgi:AcrR family transcriptional regulator